MFWRRLRARVLNLLPRSLRTHASLNITDLPRALAFYDLLGFQPVVASRSQEVVLLRNHRGDELNLVLGHTRSRNPTSVTFMVKDLQREAAFLSAHLPALEFIEEATGRRLQVQDPDGNRIGFLTRTPERAAKRIFHLLTHNELRAGLGVHYYLAPDAPNRFVRAQPRAALLSLCAQRVAEETGEIPWIAELDPSQLSMEVGYVDESTPPDVADRSAYPQVLNPIPRSALIAVGKCEPRDDEYPWPATFHTLDALTEKLSER